MVHRRTTTGVGRPQTGENRGKKISAEEMFWLSRAPAHLVIGRAITRAVILTVILVVVAAMLMIVANQGTSFLSPAIRSAIVASVSIPLLGLLVVTVFTFATAAWIDPRGLMFFVVVFSAIAVVALAMFTEGYLPCVWEIPQWGAAVSIPLPLFIAVLIGVIYALTGTERFGAIIVLLLFLFISIWPNFVSQGVNEGKQLCNWLI